MAGSVPENGQSIWDYLVGAGFSDNAAAGIEGNIEAESGGNPEAMESNQSGGGGLIQWTPISGYPGLVTGNAAKDLTAQEKGILTYVQANGSVAAINNAASTPSAAATYFQDQYERPASDTASLGVRTASATATLAAAQSGSWPASTIPPGSGNGSGNATSPAACEVWNPLTYGGCAANATATAVTGILSSFGITPKTIGDGLERAGLILFGALALLIGLRMLSSGGSSSSSSSQGNSSSGSGMSRGQSSGGSPDAGELTAGSKSAGKTVEKVAEAPVEAAAVAA